MIDRQSAKRKPVQLEQKGGKSRRQRVWEAIRTLRNHFTVYQLARISGVDDETALTYVRSLEYGGYLRCDSPTDAPIGEVKQYSLQQDNGIEAPRLTKDGKPVQQGRGTEAMWRSMRIAGDFTCRELVAHAHAAGITVSEESANSYIRALKLAGYVEVMTAARTKGIGKGKTMARYRLLASRYTGPRPPMIQRTKSVYDPNLGKVVWQQEVNDDDL